MYGTRHCKHARGGHRSSKQAHRLFLVGLFFCTRFLKDLYELTSTCDALDCVPGMGKTITVIALILSTTVTSLGRTRPTLIVSPPALVDHWERQIEEHTEAECLEVVRFDNPDSLGPNDEGSSASSLRRHNVVLTTFGICHIPALSVGTILKSHCSLHEKSLSAARCGRSGQLQLLHTVAVLQRKRDNTDQVVNAQRTIDCACSE